MPAPIPELEELLKLELIGAIGRGAAMAALKRPLLALFWAEFGFCALAFCAAASWASLGWLTCHLVAPESSGLVPISLVLTVAR